MKLGLKLLVLGLVLTFALTGCKRNQGSDEPTPPPQQQTEDNRPPTDFFTIGVSTKEDVVARLGQPNGVRLDKDGTEVLTYSSGHVTGKAFIPFYFGDDRYRTHEYRFEFRKGLLVGKSADDRNY
jgi:hypothetical protein